MQGSDGGDSIKNQVQVNEKSLEAGQPSYPPPTFPEGGFWAWSTAAGAYVLVFNNDRAPISQLEQILDPVRVFRLHQRLRRLPGLLCPTLLDRIVSQRNWVSGLPLRLGFRERQADFPCRWIGGVQIFLTFGMGLVVGKLFDKGYL